MNRITETVTIESGREGSARSGTEHDVHMDGFIHLAPSTHDISLASEHIPDIGDLAADLERAVKAGWSHRHDMRYLKVNALLLMWADDDLGVASELKDLQHVFEDLYHYAVDIYEIPSQKPDKALTRRVLDFLDQDGDETLLILYYAGHGKTSAQSNEGPTWYANRQPGSASLPSRGIQSKFEEADADVLLLYDCCNSAATAASSSHGGHKSVTEVIAACGYETTAPEVGEHSFSRALTETLVATSKGPPVSVAQLHARVLNRLKCWTPSFLKDESGKFSEDETGRLKCELQRRRTPIYGLLCETEPRRSIAFGPLSSQTSPPSVTSLPPRKRKRSLGEEIEYPQILLAIRLDKQELDLKAWKEFLLHQLPVAAKDIKIEGIYGSFSTLLLLRIPVAVWNLLPSNPAYSFVGFVTTHNLAVEEPQPSKDPEAALSRIQSSSWRPLIPKRVFTSPGAPSGVDGPPSSLGTGNTSQKDIDEQTFLHGKDISHANTYLKSPVASENKSAVKWGAGSGALESVKEVLFTQPPGQRVGHGLGISATITLSAEPTSALPTDNFKRREAEGSTGAQRSRVSKSKTRRVKCDNIRPHCLRCQKFGRLCDGYPSEHRYPPASWKPPRGVMELQPRSPSLVPYSPSTSASMTVEEDQYFRVFSERFVCELAGHFDSSPWTRLVLQESHNSPAVRHAVIALGAIHTAIETAPGPDLKVNVIQSLDKKHYDFAVHHYLMAGQSLNHYVSSSTAPQIRNALLIALLFICFETVVESQEAQTPGVQQLNVCLKLLRSYYVGNPGSRPWIPRRGVMEAEKPTHATDAQNNDLGSNDALNIRAMTANIQNYLQDENNPAFSTVINMNQNNSSSSILDSYLSSETSAFFQEVRSGSIPSIFSACSASTTTPLPFTPRTLSIAESELSDLSENLGNQTDFSPPVLRNDLHIEEIIIQTLVRLDGPSLFLGLLPSTPPITWDINQVWHLPLPPTFSDFPTAQRAWYFLMYRALQFYRRTLFNRTYSTFNEWTPSNIASQYTTFEEQITMFEKAFAPILASSIDSDGTINNAAALVISLYTKCTLILMSSLMTDSEIAFDSHLDHFRYIVHTCKLLLSSQRNPQLPRNARFSLHVGIVPPLHLTATKCRDPVVRREAVDLLFENPRQEGMWDGILSARIGRWVIACEEEGLPLPPSLQKPSAGPQSDIVEQKGHSDYAPPSHFPDSMGADIVEEIHAYGQNTEITDHHTPATKEAIATAETVEERPWTVPEENRVRLVSVDFFIADRYIRVKCQRALVHKDEKRVERETVIAW